MALREQLLEALDARLPAFAALLASDEGKSLFDPAIVADYADPADALVMERLGVVAFLSGLASLPADAEDLDDGGDIHALGKILILWCCDWRVFPMTVDRAWLLGAAARST